jgi:hypothetical protein
MFNPCFPLRRACLLLLCWVNLFPSILSKHLNYYVSLIHMLICSIMFTIFLCLVQCIYLKEYIFESFLWLWRDCYDWVCDFCFISSDIKRLHSKYKYNSFIVLWPRIKVCHHQSWFTLCIFIVIPFAYCKSNYMKGSCDACGIVNVNHRPVGNPKRKVWWI